MLDLERDNVKLRKPIFAGNWKMYKTILESVATAIDLKARVSGI